MSCLQSASALTLERLDAHGAALGEFVLDYRVQIGRRPDRLRRNLVECLLGGVEQSSLR